MVEINILEDNLRARLVIGFVKGYYTSNAYSPVQDAPNSFKTGAPTNLFSHARLCSGASLGMLSTIATGLTIDAYGPIDDNAGGIT
ncbi:hypothetical protein SADUNF_Sadunf03G0017400 [Salix dunnii]|uniref:H(+)-exporting diphosphatase n=1 Tax=Salix dunnii TaxID=1413687 RepID=A0A835KAS8_9ROSI|nr:hypothetical protein SADUNF_Sadunf03G0017400 [Salix dunnii]